MPRLRQLRDQTRGFFRELAADIRRPHNRRQRLLDEAETLLSVTVAIIFAHLIGAENVGWAAFSGYVVMRMRLSETLTRGTLRILGTVSGAALAWLAISHLGHSRLLLSALLAGFGGFTLYAALTRQRSYAWLFTGLTFAMVVLDALAAPLQDVAHFAESRVLEVTAGTLACLMVSLITDRTLRPWLLGPQATAATTPTSRSVLWNRDAALHALQTAIGLMLLPALSFWISGNTLSQAAITIMAVMMIPLPSLQKDPALVSRRVLFRFAGCTAGAAVAGLGLLLAHHHIAPMMLCLALGVVVGRHIENSGGRYAYMGTQFALVFLVVFVPDSYTALGIDPGIERLWGIVLGMILLLGLRGIWSLPSQWRGNRL